MAYFDYTCEKCNKPFEIQCGINDDRSNVKCPHCKSNKVQRLFNSIQLGAKSEEQAPTGSKIGYRGRGSKNACAGCASKNCSSCG
jgi:putative FmdB family regulatory protein